MPFPVFGRTSAIAKIRKPDGDNFDQVQFQCETERFSFGRALELSMETSGIVIGMEY
jgi:hypothetical protein